MSFRLYIYTLPEKIPPLEYPSCPPTLGVRNPRGLDEAAVAGLLADMNARLDFLKISSKFHADMNAR